MIRAVLVISFLMVSLFSSVASASDLKWSSLTVNEKKVLKSFKNSWNELSNAEQRSLKTKANISPAKWGQIKLKHKQWKSFTPKQRRVLEKKIRKYKATTSRAERARIRKWQQWVNALPLPVQKKFKHAKKTMSVKEMRSFYLKLKKKYP